MVTPFRARLAVALGGVAVSLIAGAGAGVASADPMGAAIGTTCSYPQLVAALNAQSPATAQKFNQSPAAQAWVRSFVASSPDRRRAMAQDAQSVSGAQQYVGLIGQIANSCHQY